MKQRWSLMAVACAIGTATAAGCDDGGDADAGCVGVICVFEDAGTDGSVADAGPDGTVVIDPCDFNIAGRNIGSACSSNRCRDPLTCYMEQAASLSGVLNRDGSAGAPNLPITLSPEGGECSETCDMQAATDPCGDCSSCSGLAAGTITGIPYDVAADGTVLGFCRPDCTPTATDNGGCREGYTCDLNSATCVEACISDMQCKFGLEDADGDGGVDIVFLGNDYPATCNLTTGRCETEGTATAGPGDACADVLDCEDNGYCITGDDVPAGFCTRFGCQYEGFECQTGAVCDLRTFGAGYSACLPGCSVGTETEEQRTGAADGQGNGCELGQACLWDGSSAPDAAVNGGCFPAEYNDITASTVGNACQTSADCYSPFGLGRCFFRNGEANGDTSDGSEVPSGICVVADCATFMDSAGATVEGILPGVGDAAGSHRICAEANNELCVRFSGEDEPVSTYCLQECTNASECPTGYGCTNLNTAANPLVVCWPYCSTTSECRTGQSCLDDAGGACDPTMDDCFCTPACTQDSECASIPGANDYCHDGNCRACNADTDAGCTGATPQCLSDYTCAACDPSDDAGCSGATPQCDPATNTCVACLATGTGTATDAGCTTELPQCSAGACVACLTDTDCADTTETPECVSNACVACDPANDSGCDAAGSTPQCSPATNTCVACIDDATGAGMDSGCDTTTPNCVGGTCIGGCTDDTQCTVTGFEQCVSGACAACDSADDAGCDPTGGTPECNPTTLLCGVCDPVGDTGCSDTLLDHCGPLATCVDCLDDTHCTTPATCIANVCVGP
jgi:hypothetical protein